MKDVEGMEVQLQVFFVVALDGCERSDSRSIRLIPSKRAFCIRSGQGVVVVVVVEMEPWLFGRYSVATLTELSRLITT